MRGFSLLAASAALAMAGSAGAAITTAYSSTTTTGSDGAFFDTRPGFAQAITLSTADAPVGILSFSVFGLRWNSTPATSQQIKISFYSNANETAGATSAISGANLAGSATFVVPPLAVGSVDYTFNGVNVLLPGNHVLVIIECLDNTGTAYSTALGGRYTTGAPTIGSNDGFVYFDNNSNHVFAGSERTRLNGASSGTPVATNIRMALDIPSPGAATLLGLGGLAAARRRRSRA